MLERMFFDVTRGGVHSQVDVTVKDGLVYHKARLFNSMPDLSVKPNEPYVASEEWLMLLARLNLSGLDRHYRSEQPEDVFWSLVYKDEGREEVRSDGQGAYPPGWDDLLLLVDQLAPEAEFIDPWLIETIYMTYTDLEDTEFGPQSYTEEMSLDRRTQKLMYRRSFSQETYVQTEYRNMNEVSIGLDLWDRFFADEPTLSMDDTAPEEPARFDVRVDRHDGSQEHYLWHYNRTCLPEEWPRFMGMIGHRLQLSTMFINIVSPSVYLHGARAGELIYATVHIEELGRCYYYLTNDNSLRKGDMVLVPYGESNAPMKGEIKKIEYYFPEDVPHPIAEMKSILGRHSDPEQENR
ncbi:MAG: hypothetical protein IKX83_05895 [Clostridia bacterium]|nr:hypothetical protein [Clostridia bacterium]